MQISFAISATFHVGILVIAYWGVPVLFTPPAAMPAPIPVELVMIDEVTTPKVKDESEPPKPQPKPEVKAKPEPAKPPPPKAPLPPSKPIAKPDLPALPPPPLPQETEVAELQLEPSPLPKPKKLEPKPKEIEPSKLETKPLPEPPKPMAKPAPKPVTKPVTKPKKKLVQRLAPRPLARPQAEAKFDPNRISALLDKTPQKKSPPPPTEAEKKKRTIDDIKIKSRAQPVKLASAPTISEIDFIRRQLLDCWYPPGGAKDLQDMRVTIRVELNSDGTLVHPPVVVDRIGRGTTGEAFFRTFEESALRAVRACTDPKDPLQLPPGEANKWRDLEFTFDPRDMLG